MTSGTRFGAVRAALAYNQPHPQVTQRIDVLLVGIYRMMRLSLLSQKRVPKASIPEDIGDLGHLWISDILAVRLDEAEDAP